MAKTANLEVNTVISFLYKIERFIFSYTSSFHQSSLANFGKSCTTFVIFDTIVSVALAHSIVRATCGFDLQFCHSHK